MLCAPQLGHTFDHDLVGAGAVDLGSHRVQELGQVLNVGLAGGVEDVAAAVRQDCGHQDVLRPGHSRQVEDHAGALQPAGRGRDEITFALVYLRTHLAQPPHVLLDATRPDLVTARAGNPGFARPRQ